MFDVRNVKVGDEVAFAYFHSMGTPLYKGFGTVTKINGHGHIILDNGKVFDKRGKERGMKYSETQLMCPDHLREILTTQEQRRARTQTVRDMIEKLNGCITYVGTAQVDAELKADLQALLNQL